MPVTAPEAGDLPGLEALLDMILGPKVASIYGEDTPLLDRIECKLGMVLDRHHAEKVEGFHEMVGATKSPLIKERNIEVFVKGMMSALVEDAERGPPPPPPTPKKPAAAASSNSSSNGKRKSVPTSKAAAAAAKKSAPPKKAGGGGGASKASAASSDVSSLDEISKSDMSEDEEAALRKLATKTGGGSGGGGGGGPARKAAVLESPDVVMEGSDGQMRGLLHLVERCPAFVYNSWRDMDHDVYLYGFPLLAAKNRMSYPGGIIAFFPGFGSYKEYTDKAFRSITMPGELPTRLRPRDEIFGFLQKGTQMRSTAKGGSGEAARRKAYVAAWNFFQQHIFKEEVTPEDPFPPLARRVPSKNKKRSASSQPPVPKKRPRVPPAPLPPLPPAALPAAALPSTDHASPRPPQPAAAEPQQAAAEEGLDKEIDMPAAMDEAGVALATGGGEAAAAAEEGGLGEEVWATLPDPEDKSIRGLFASLRWRLERLEEVCEGDPFFWSLKSSQSNIDNVCDRLFGDPMDPEAEDWRRMVVNSLDKARKKLEEKLRGMASADEVAKPTYVHGRALLDVYAELKEAVGKFEEGQEEEVEGWDSMDFPVRDQTPAPAAEEATGEGGRDKEEEEEEEEEAKAKAGEDDGEKPPSESDEKEGSVAAELPGASMDEAPAPVSSSHPPSPTKATAPTESEGEEEEEEENDNDVDSAAAAAAAAMLSCAKQAPPVPPAEASGDDASIASGDS